MIEHLKHFGWRLVIAWAMLQGHVLKFFMTPSNILSVIALTVSVAGFYLGEDRRKKDVQFDVISKTYEKNYEMNRMQLDGSVPPQCCETLLTTDWAAAGVS